MNSVTNRQASPAMVVIAFAIVYLVWGSTYLFIRLAIEDIPAMLMAAVRFLFAGALMMAWCLFKKEKMFSWQNIKPAIVSGLLMLFLGTGAVVWSEQYISSSLAAILVSAGPIWFVLLDKMNWKKNLGSRETVIGLVIGFLGVILLFGENLMNSLNASGNDLQMIASGALILGSIAWAGGSLYSKYKSSASSSNSVNSAWQMLAAGIAFVPVSLLSGETQNFHISQVSGTSWLALFYLITMGSLAGFSAYVWLLRVRSATQVSTHSYVNPVVAVLLGVFFANEEMSVLQISGLAIILVSVLLINISKYRKSANSLELKAQPKAKVA
jgi:drug/metabolite transporter (DMT)-like permease